MMRRLFYVAAAVACLLMAAAGVQAEDRLVWQIGKADNSYDEFAIARDYPSYMRDFGEAKVFDPAKDDASKSWPFIEPGPSDSWAGNREHPLTVAFDLEKQPAGTFTLTVDLVDTHGGEPPVFEISINGKSGRFSLPRGEGDVSLTNPARGKEYVLKIPFPASFLNAGRNQITMKTVEGSWLMFDYLSLRNSPESMPEPSVKQITVTPTIRFVQDGSKLKQVIEMSAEFSPGSPMCTVTVDVDGVSQAFTVEPNLMGTAQRELYVDEITQPTTAEVSIKLGDKVKTATCDMKPQRHWRVYVQASSHVDIGYTDLQERVAKLHNDNMSLALDLCKQYPDFKWNTEVAWVQDNYMSMMPADKKADFLKYAKSGQIGCQAIYGNMLTGICSHESFIRDLYYAKNMSRKYGIPYDIAMSSDVPTQVWTLPTVLAGAGIKYFSAGLNLTRGNSFDKLYGKSLFYWKGPDDAKVLTWLAPGYAYAASLHLFGKVSQAEPHVQNFLRGFDRADYPYDAVLAFGGLGDNQPLTPGLAPLVSDWNKKYAYPKIILCRGPEFFKYVEAGFKDKIPTISGDGGVYWEDGAGSSAMETAMVRQAKETLATSEKMSSLAGLLYGTPYPKADFDDGWKNSILYDEHTWGAAQSISDPTAEQTVEQWKRKSQFAVDADVQAKVVLQKGMDALTEPLRVKNRSLFVFNPMSWKTSGWVTTLDENGKRVVAYAQDVPPLGYKLIPVPKSVTIGRALPASAGRPVMENNYYRVEFDPSTGAVKSLYDKELKREMVDQAGPYGLNQYVYTSGRTQDQRTVDIKDITREGVTSPITFSEHLWNVGRSMHIEGEAKNTQWTTHAVLFDRVKRIDFINVLNKKETTDKEAGYFAFPFALEKPEWHVELPNGVVNPNTQMLPGADMSWYCAQDFAAASDAKGAVVWTAVDSPLLTLGDINRDTFQSPIPVTNGHIYAYAFNNYWFTNYKASQGGEMTFRYSITSMPGYDPLAASRFGQSVRCPLVAAVLEPKSKGRVSSTASICSVSAPNVVIQAVKRAETGKGMIIRLRELSGKKTTATLSLSLGKFKDAYSCNLVEDPQKKLALVGGKVKVVVPAYGMATVRLSLP